MGHFLYDWFNIKAGWFGLGVGWRNSDLFLVLAVGGVTSECIHFTLVYRSETKGLRWIGR